MLVSKLQKDDIVSFRLSSGQEVVAKFVEDTATNLIVKNPQMLVPVNNNGQQGLGLVPLMETVEGGEPMEISKTQITSKGKSRKEIIEVYNQVTGAIQTPPAQGLLGV